MIRTLLTLIIACATLQCAAQVNFVINGDFEKYSECPDGWNEIHFTNGWRNVKDSVMELGLEYYNMCGNGAFEKSAHVPDNVAFYQHPHSANGMAGAHLYFDKKTAIPSPLPFNYRDYLQGHLLKKLVAGKTYCVSLFVNLAEGAGYGQNKIGVFLDDGGINLIPDTAGKEITSVLPQIYSDSIIPDTGLWHKIEGTFIATGNEDHITIGNFFPNSSTLTVKTDYWGIFSHFSYYLIDDVSIVESDHKADAGPDSWVPVGSARKIGPSEPSAIALDCKWYKKGTLIDSGATITVNSSGLVGTVDTYVVIQTLCGVITRDTMLLSTVPVNIIDPTNIVFSAYPNPSEGSFTIRNFSTNAQVTTIKIHDLFGRVVIEEKVTSFPYSFNLTNPPGVYILEVSDKAGNVFRERIFKR